MTSFTIASFEPADEQGVIDVILSIQRDEFGIPISAEDQPDLRAIPTFYQTGTGFFLVAKSEGRVVGTIALKDIGSRQAALRKMFVASGFRGRAHGVAQALLQELFDKARQESVETIFLGTIDKFLAARRFYEKAGFRLIDPESLPTTFPRMAVDTHFYCLDL